MCLHRTCFVLVAGQNCVFVCMCYPAPIIRRYPKGGWRFCASVARNKRECSRSFYLSSSNLGFWFHVSCVRLQHSHMQWNSVRPYALDSSQRKYHLVWHALVSCTLDTLYSCSVCKCTWNAHCSYLLFNYSRHCGTWQCSDLHFSSAYSNHAVCDAGW